jgi:hypothetical protein
MDYLNQRKEQKALTSQIAEVTQTLGDMPEPPQNLEQQLAAAEASLVAEQDAFPGKMDTTQVVDTILRLADDCQVKAIPLITEPWSKENIGQHDYYVFRLNLAVEGSFSQLVNFVGELENGGFNTLIVENVSLTRLSQQSEDEGANEETILVIASLDLAIYTQSLNTD